MSCLQKSTKTVFSACVVVIFISSLIAVLAIYLSFADKVREDWCPAVRRKTSNSAEERDLICSIGLDIKWTPEMNSSLSNDFNNTSCLVQELVDAIFKEYNPMKGFNYTLVTQLIEENHTIRAEYELYFTNHEVPLELQKEFDKGVSFVLSSKKNKIISKIFNWSLNCNATTTNATTTASPPLCQQPLPPKPLPGDTCGRSRASSTRIIGGTSTECRSKYPWLVLLLHNKQLLCGATIWDRQHVLTAAHCLEELVYDKTSGLVNVSGLEIIAGKWELAINNIYNGFEQRLAVINATIHTVYENLTNKADIALMRLATPINITDTSLAICHPNNYTKLPKNAIVAGWGTLVSGKGVYPTVYHEVNINLYNSSDCYSLFGPFFSDGNISRYLHNDSVICGGYVEGGKDSCQGDSGGPLFWIDEDTGRYTMIGIVSHGYGCAFPGHPGFYTYVPVFLEWIEDRSKFMAH